MENGKSDIQDQLNQKSCTWKSCERIATHCQSGSMIALCDEHENILNNSIKNLVQTGNIA